MFSLWVRVNLTPLFLIANFRYLATALFEKIETKMEGEYFSTWKKTYLFKVIERKQLSGELEIPTLNIILDQMRIILMGLYKPPCFNEKDFLFHLNNPYKFFCTKYENITLIVNFTMIPENKKLSNFCEMKFEHLIMKPICCKGLLLFY